MSVPTLNTADEKPRIFRRRRQYHGGYEWVYEARGDDGFMLDGCGKTPEAAERDWDFWNVWGGCAL